MVSSISILHCHIVFIVTGPRKQSSRVMAGIVDQIPYTFKKALSLYMPIYFPISFRHLEFIAGNGIGKYIDRKSTTSELQSRFDLVCRLLLEKKNHLHTRQFKFFYSIY